MGLRDKDRTIMVRMERCTHDRLQNLRGRMEAHAQKFPYTSDGRLLEDVVSLSTVVEILIDRWEAHKARAYRNRRSKLPKNNGTMPPPATESGG